MYYQERSFSLGIMAYLLMKNGDHLIDVGRRQTWKRTREC